MKLFAAFYLWISFGCAHKTLFNTKTNSTQEEHKAHLHPTHSQTSEKTHLKNPTTQNSHSKNRKKYSSSRTPSAEGSQVYSHLSDLNQDNWLQATNGRTVYLFGSNNPNKIKHFVSSGRLSAEKQLGIWKVVLFHAVYYSNEENFDTSKDMPASVMVYDTSNKKNPKLVFAGKGYKFFILENPETIPSAAFILRHWAGMMGCSFTDLEFPKNNEDWQLSQQHRLTASITVTNKIGELCTPYDSFSRLEDIP